MFWTKANNYSLVQIKLITFYKSTSQLPNMLLVLHVTQTLDFETSNYLSMYKQEKLEWDTQIFT